MAVNDVDFELIKKGLRYSGEKKKWILALGALGFTSYGAYRLYNSPSVVRKRQRLLKLLGAFASLAEMVSDSSEAIGTVSRDFKEFIQSDSDQIPKSLRQISKITSSDEFSETLSRISRALTVGIVRGYRYENMTRNGGARPAGNSSFSDKLLNKLFTDAGSGFASVVIGSFAKNLVMGLYSVRPQPYGDRFGESNTKSRSAPRWIDVLCEEKGRELLADCIRIFVSTAVAVYLDKTLHINTYDEIFSGMTNPKHEMQVRHLMLAVCNGAMETLIRTSHHVLTSPNSCAESKPNSSSPAIDHVIAGGPGKDYKGIVAKQSVSGGLKVRKWFDERKGSSGWIGKVSSTLAVPGNRRLVLDLTGRVTFETVRSFLEFLLQRVMECLKRSVDVIHEEVIERGEEALKYVTGKSSNVASVCLSLCLHILNGPWVLVPPSNERYF